MQEGNVEFSELLREAGVKPSALSSVTGISQPMLSQIKKGRRTPSSQNIIKIAIALGVEPVRVWSLFYGQQSQ